MQKPSAEITHLALCDTEIALTHIAKRASLSFKQPIKLVKKAADEPWSWSNNPVSNYASEFMKSKAMEGAGQYWKDNPWLQTGLYGAGAGGLLGLGSELFSGRRNKRPLSSLLTGAMLGAGTGAGVHYLTNPKSDWMGYLTGPHVPSIKEKSDAFVAEKLKQEAANKANGTQAPLGAGQSITNPYNVKRPDGEVSNFFANTGGKDMPIGADDPNAKPNAFINKDTLPNWWRSPPTQEESAAIKAQEAAAAASKKVLAETNKFLDPYNFPPELRKAILDPHIHPELLAKEIPNAGYVGNTVPDVLAIRKKLFETLNPLTEAGQEQNKQQEIARRESPLNFNRGMVQGGVIGAVPGALNMARTWTTKDPSFGGGYMDRLTRNLTWDLAGLGGGAALGGAVGRSQPLWGLDAGIGETPGTTMQNIGEGTSDWIKKLYDHNNELLKNRANIGAATTAAATPGQTNRELGAPEPDNRTGFVGKWLQDQWDKNQEMLKSRPPLFGSSQKWLQDQWDKNQEMLKSRPPLFGSSQTEPSTSYTPSTEFKSSFPEPARASQMSPSTNKEPASGLSGYFDRLFHPPAQPMQTGGGAKSIDIVPEKPKPLLPPPPPVKPIKKPWS